MNEAAELEVLLEEHCNQGLENNGLTLQMIFRPLDINEHLLPIRQETKVKIHDTRNFPRPILRVYGIRLGDNTFVITGGSVKLTKYMKDHPDTNIELEKLKVVKAFLKENDIDTDEDLNYFYEQS